jgi:hypothetical protein
MFEAWQANYKCPEIDFFFEFFQSQKSVLWIRVGFNADTDPAFYFISITIQIRIWIGSQTNADPDPGHTLVTTS